MRRIFLVLLTALVVAIAVACSPAHASSPVEISKIYYNPPGRDTRSNRVLNQEWVQLHNRSGSRVTLTGWTLRDAQGHTYRFGAYTLRAGGYVKIHTGKGTNTQTDRFWGRSWYIWNNDRDTATLKNRGGSVIDRCSYSGGRAYKIC